MDIFEKYAERKNGELVITIDGFRKMIDEKVLNENKLRNERIRMMYSKIKQTKLKRDECIEQIRGEYPYLAPESILKIIYRDREK